MSCFSSIVSTAVSNMSIWSIQYNVLKVLFIICYGNVLTNTDNVYRIHLYVNTSWSIIFTYFVGYIVKQVCIMSVGSENVVDGGGGVLLLRW